LCRLRHVRVHGSCERGVGVAALLTLTKNGWCVSPPGPLEPKVHTIWPSAPAHSHRARSQLPFSRASCKCEGETRRQETEAAVGSGVRAI
jgi:hypothetical protein